jgi:hypothetical protein
MKPKIGLALLTFSVALFASGPVANLISHSKSYGNVAWAQDAGDSTDDGADVATEPDKKVPPPDIAGDWSGSIIDDDALSTTFAIEVFQKHSKIMGSWTTGAGGSGSYKGSISSNGEDLKFKLKQKGNKCSISAKGTIQLPVEISGGTVSEPTIEGTYNSKKCQGVTKGTFTLTMMVVL